MKKLTDIVEVKSTLHPNALHVSPVKVDGQTKYKVKAVGKNFADGIKVGEHLTDTHLDDCTEMGCKIKHIKEEAEQIDEISTGKLLDYVSAASRDVGRRIEKNEPGIEPFKKTLKRSGKIGRAMGELKYRAAKKTTNEEVELQEGEEAAAQFQKYHEDTAKLLKNINSGLSKHFDKVTNPKGVNGGQAHWGHVGDIKSLHRDLQDVHDRILQTGEYANPEVKAVKESVEPEADMNILVQLRKPVDILEHGTQGGADVTFGDGETVFIEGEVAKKLVESIEAIKPEDRVKVAEFLYQSHDNLMAVFARLK